jgi:penicillin-binding protein 1C
VLDQYGSDRFVSKLRQGGLKLRFPRGATPNLSVILGGADTSLEYLVGAYAAFALVGRADARRGWTFEFAQPGDTRSLRSIRKDGMTV